MNKTLAFFWVALLGACTSLQGVAIQPEDLQARIRAGELIRPGERIAVTTADGRETAFEVVERTPLVLRGRGVEVPIDEIVALRTERFDFARTAGATAGTVALAYVAAAVAAFLSVIEALE